MDGWMDEFKHPVKHIKFSQDSISAFFSGQSELDINSECGPAAVAYSPSEYPLQSQITRNIARTRRKAARELPTYVRTSTSACKLGCIAAAAAV